MFLNKSFYLVLTVLIFFFGHPSMLWSANFKHFQPIEGDTISASQYFQKAQRFQDSTLLDSAIFYNKLAIKYFNDKKISPQKSFEYEKNLFEIFKKQRDFKQGTTLLNEMLITYQDSSHLSYIYYNKAYFTELQQDYPVALTLYKKALALDPNKTPYGRIICGLARIKLRQGKFREAQRLYQEAIPIQEADTTELPSYMASLYLNAGVAFGLDGFYQEALLYYRKCFEITKEKLGKESPYYGYCLVNFGAIEDKLGNYYKALEYYRAASVIIEEVQGANDYVAVTYNNIGVIHETLKQYEEAEKAYEKAITIIDQMPSKNLVDMVDYRLCLGRLYSKTNRYQAAIDLLLPNLDTTRQVLGEAHPNIAKTLTSLGHCYEQLGRWEEALKLHRQATLFLREHLGEEHPNLSKSLNNLGNLLFKMGQTDAALTAFQESLWGLSA